MAVHTVQTTTNFVVKYDDSNTQAQGMANAIASVCESEFTVLTGWFGITSGFGTGDRITVTVQSISSGGADNFGYQSGGNSVINVNFLPAGFTQAQANKIAPMMFVNELVEVFMSFNTQNGGSTWNAKDSGGEGLSQFCGILRFPAGHYLAYPSWVNKWLSSSRDDFVTANKSTDGDAVSFGCALLFILYLNTQLGFSPAKIIQAGTGTLAGTYTKLTSDPGNPFGLFLQLINGAFPGTSTITSGSGQALDDPFPIVTFQFWDDKNTFGKDEVTDSVAHNRPFTDALLLVLEGLSPLSWQSVGSPTPATFSGPAAAFPDISFTRTHVVFENGAVPAAPQRIHFHYDIGFGSHSAGGFTSSPQTLELDSSITIAGQTVPAATELDFFGAEDPYFSNINPKADNVPWLSNDLRVFATLGSGAPVPNGPTFPTDSIQGARDYLKSLLGYLNGTYGDPSGTDPFDPANNVIPEQTDALSGDSSVLPNLGFLGLGGNVYNFAIARVRLRAPLGTASKPVKVFFRLWQSQSPDTDYNASTTYNSHKDSVGLPDWPLPDSDSSTFPFFATGNTPPFGTVGDPEFGPTGVNSQTITIDHSDGQWGYFGCLLNVYDNSYLVNGTPVTQLLPGTHHCLVAQIAYDDAPIIVPAGQAVNPGNTDKLAQRNLQITPAFNPGTPPTNRVPQTFDVRPSDPAQPDNFDELMIEWGNTPVGSVATLYWPTIDPNTVLELADAHYGYHNLSLDSEPSTIRCEVVDGLTYVPIPPRTGANLASLLTVELPGTVVKGQQFTVVVRRVTTYNEPPPPRLQSPAIASPAGASPPVTGPQKPPKGPKPEEPASTSWRYITGAFQVNVPVKADADILPFDENTLAIFKWRLKVTPPSNRWYPVLQRYISYLSDRIDGLGGDAGAIEPSPTGLPPRKEIGPSHDRHTVRGKVAELVYDCLGDFEGFRLRRCCEEDKLVRSRERGIEEVVRWALRERVLVEVVLCKHDCEIETLRLLH